MTEYRTVRHRLKELRKKKGTQEQVGLALGVTGTMIRLVENGYTTGSGNLMLRLCGYVGGTVEECFPDVHQSSISYLNSK
ncbi:helix-turn-helix transcriptional regulator [Paenibacillus sp. EKM205P]|uniref:helix-turn-helix transcriptional regulator n=1 Tax=Paenibacillus sp. EKM205P TaxID=1683673 RepID=UPI0013EB7E42|nr:helix-turn-helix transcriptional regulator [Paenibacillus sp. EKM205P]KAF6591026.1 helix-turn-helix transcriptional regulator [Paenibacillus sp. EKM205P]